MWVSVIFLKGGTLVKMPTKRIQILGSLYPTNIKVANVTMYADNWVGDSSPYSQVLKLDGITPYSQVDLKPNVQQLATFYEKDLSFVTENEDGIVTVYAIGDKPMNDYTIQVSITEVSV